MAGRGWGGGGCHRHRTVEFYMALADIVVFKFLSVKSSTECTELLEDWNMQN